MDIAQAPEPSTQTRDDRPSRSRRNKARHDIQHPHQYADAIDSYSKLSATNSLYAGPHFESLAAYLQQPFEPRVPDLLPKNCNNELRQKYRFVSLYDLDPASPKRVRHINDINVFELESSNLLANSNHGHLLFMRGHPSPEWLLSIGTKYHVDPEFFQRHLDFRQSQPDHFSLPSLPSASTSMVKLRITTIGGSRSRFGVDPSQEALELLQARNEESMDTYLGRLRSHNESNLGDSIVRHCSIHDMRHFTIEQDISIYVSKCEKGWVGLVWLDNGNDLSDGFASWLKSPLRTQPWKINYIPVLQSKHGNALKSPSRLIAPIDRNESSQGKIPQSASLLHLDYGRTLDRNVAAVDAFYVLHELFRFAAFSEVQFLNMFESKLRQELDQSALVRQKNLSLSSLLYNQQILDRHVQRIQENIVSFQNRRSSTWPQSSLDAEKQRKADAAADALLQDYEYLLARALTLSEQCHRGMKVVMNYAMIKESREAISQAERVAKLTKLAFFFIPMSFTSSIFGMNFSEFGQGTLSLWIWLLVSVPIFALSLLFMKYEVVDILKGYLQSKKRNKFKTKDKYDFAGDFGV